MNELLIRMQSMERHWTMARLAHERGWHAAAAQQERQVLSEAGRIELAASRLITEPMYTGIQVHPPTLKHIFAELQQLEDEFENVEINLKEGLVVVTTGRIVLEDIDLGPFSIELHVSRLAERQDGGGFNCVGLDPNPAASRGDTVHPHVQDGHLCAGEATLPIAVALKDGRLADAFILIKSVLETYNESSPYIALSDWSGRRCQDCDYLADSDGMYFCDGCDRDVCEECYSSCDMCDEGSCRSCLETDPVSGNRCCSACRHTCSECDRTVDEESFDDETELCPACLEKHKQEMENEHELESNPVDSTTTALPTPAPAAA